MYLVGVGGPSIASRDISVFTVRDVLRYDGQKSALQQSWCCLVAADRYRAVADPGLTLGGG